MGPIIIGNCTIYHGDCLEVMPTIRECSVDAIITDLPYGRTSCTWDVVIPFAPMWAEVKRLLKSRGVFVTTARQPFTSMLVMSNLAWFKYCWVWDKVRAGNFLTAKLKPMIAHDDIAVFSPATVANCCAANMVYNPQMTKRDKPIKYRKGRDSELYARKNTISVSYVSDTKYPKSILCFDKEVGLHPTQKPVSLYEYLIRTYTNEGDTVLDIAMGSGTTCVAAMQTGRKAVGIEKREDYITMAVKRIEQASMALRLPEIA